MVLCSQAQKDLGATLAPLNGVTALDEALDTIEACDSQSDCGEGLACFPYYLTMNEEATIYDNGSACFDEGLVEVCGEADHNMGGTMRFVNSEYDGLREYSIDFSCELVASGASYIATAFVAAIASLNMF